MSIGRLCMTRLEEHIYFYFKNAEGLYTTSTELLAVKHAYTAGYHQALQDASGIAYTEVDRIDTSAVEEVQRACDDVGDIIKSLADEEV